jgi:hypothetical protein
MVFEISQELKAEPDLLVEIIKLSSSQPQLVPQPQQPLMQPPSPQPAPSIFMHSANGPFGPGAEWNARR